MHNLAITVYGNCSYRQKFISIIMNVKRRISKIIIEYYINSYSRGVDYDSKEYKRDNILNGISHVDLIGFPQNRESKK